jgi:hypothetical protein
VLADDLDTLAFMKNLREEIIDLYVTMLVSAGETNHSQLFEQYLASIFGFLEETMKLEGFGDLRMVRLVVSLIGDIATSFSERADLKSMAT